ncbi:hypothetical protein EON71_00620 [bacterium]|nr:MAG: hypothetical protein EON71_00620 [bacterium]
MGALTAKPTAFNFRTWEVNSIKYSSCQDSLVPNIRVDLYQKKIVRVLPLEDWISDNIRFLFLDLDKQTFKSPALIFKINRNFLIEKTKKILRQHSSKVVFGYLVKRILKKRLNDKKINLNLLFGTIFSNTMIPYHRLNHSCVNLNYVLKNSFLDLIIKVDINKYNEIFLLNINPRLDSPLFNLKLKEALENGKNIKSIGNNQSSYPNIGNNLSKLINISSKSLLVHSESIKDNKWLNSLKNRKINLSPVYLNYPLSVYNNSKLYSDYDSINFLLCLPETLNKKKHFTVNFSTNVQNLEFDIFFPTTNYFVSSGNMISTRGNHKLKMIRPSYNLSDYIMSLSIMLNNVKHFKSLKDSTKIFNIIKNNAIFSYNNRLGYNYNLTLPLQKLNKLYGQS